MQKQKEQTKSPHQSNNISLTQPKRQLKLQKQATLLKQKTTKGYREQDEDEYDDQLDKSEESESEKINDENIEINDPMVKQKTINNGPLK